MLVVDGLHEVIDHDGYGTGDAILAQLASRLVDQLDADVLIAHAGTAQFGILVPQGLCTVDLAGRLVAAIEVPFDRPSGSALLTGNAGISMAAPSPTEDDTVISRAVQDAEAAAVAARTDGTDNIGSSSPTMREQQNRRRRMELLIREAAQSDRIRLDHQPVFDLATGLLVSAEALLRVSGVDGQPIAPSN